jgi:ribosomal protein S18 acetylase RimI-like enzyme
MSAVSYRDAAPADAAALAALGRQTFGETFGHLYSAENLAAFLETHNEAGWGAQLADPAFAVRVAEADGALVAYAKLGPTSLPFEPRGIGIELRQFYLLKPWHGLGIADELMRWTIGEARRHGAEDLYLSVFVDNHRARRFYARYGFDYVGQYAFMVGTHADEDHVMRLSLRDVE